jgi:L-ascorbate metabolism protein UlaG (beta-lactamase superfamily)
MGRKILISILILGLVLAITAYFVFQLPVFGGTFEGGRLALMKKSPQYKGGRFENTPPQEPGMHLIETLKKYMQGQVREPTFEVPVVKIEAESLTGEPEPGLRTYWLGHSSVLVEIDGLRVMTDPVLSEYAAPFQGGPFMPKRLHPVPIELDKIPKIDAVVISHDHYDHLDIATVTALASKGTHFFVGLGVGAHLERWNIPEDQIHELDWGEDLEIGNLSVHCEPARHYSGRKKMDNSTLWAAWVVKGPEHSFYYSGDTGYASHFSETKRRLGAVDLSIIKIGAYGETWLDIHMDPEMAIQAHQDLGAKILLPVHWATFNLSYHAWEEPIVRALARATQSGVEIVTPMIGEKFTFGQKFENKKWFLPVNSN